MKFHLFQAVALYSVGSGAVSRVSLFTRGRKTISGKDGERKLGPDAVVTPNDARCGHEIETGRFRYDGWGVTCLCAGQSREASSFNGVEGHGRSSCRLAHKSGRNNC